MENENQDPEGIFFQIREKFGAYFGCEVNGKRVYFVPHYHQTNGKRFVDGCTLSEEVLDCSAQELASVKKIFKNHALAVGEYYDIFTCDNEGEYNYPPERLREILEFKLTDQERQLIEGKLNQLTKIYLIKDNTTSLIKIGRSDNPEQRLKTLIKQDTLLPTTNDFVLLGYVEAYPIFETNLHKRYSSKRVRGEWFRLSKEDIFEVLGSINY